MFLTEKANSTRSSRHRGRHKAGNRFWWARFPSKPAKCFRKCSRRESPQCPERQKHEREAEIIAHAEKGGHDRDQHGRPRNRHQTRPRSQGTGASRSSARKGTKRAALTISCAGVRDARGSAIPASISPLRTGSCAVSAAIDSKRCSASSSISRERKFRSNRGCFRGLLKARRRKSKAITSMPEEPARVRRGIEKAQEIIYEQRNRFSFMKIFPILFLK